MRRDEGSDDTVCVASGWCVKEEQSVVVNVNGGLLRLRFGDGSRHRIIDQSHSHTRSYPTVTNKQTLSYTPNVSLLVCTCRGPTTFISFHYHVGTFLAALAPCVSLASERLSALFPHIVIMARLFDPKHARLVSVVAATVIALACGTNVSRHSPARRMD